MNVASSLTLWQQAREALVPLVTYWLLVVIGLGSFCGVILVTEGPTTENLLILGCFAAATVAGVVIGQGLAFFRVRTWLVLVAGAVSWAVFFTLTLTVAASGGGVFSGILFAFLFLTPIAMTGGMWSLETNRALWSIWLPLLYLTGAVLVWSDKRGNDAAWFAGDKWAIWDVASLIVLFAGVVLTLIYLVSRETHRLALWRRGPTAPLMPSMVEKGASRPRLTPLGLLLLLGVAVLLAAGTAVVSPYLWRTGPGDEPDDDPAPVEESTDGREPYRPEPGDGEMMKRLAEMAEQAVEAAKQAGGVICSSLVALLLALLGLLLGYRPLKRLFTLRHLKDPFWKVSPTTRIDHGWRLVEIALGDVGVHPRPGEDAAGLARRARPVLEALSPVPVHGLEDAAEVADRVRFGLGVSPSDLAVMDRFSRWAIDTVWERLDDKTQVQAMYREL